MQTYERGNRGREIKGKVTQAGLEPATPCSGGKCSNPLSYWARVIILANIRRPCQCAGKAAIE